MMVNSLVDVAMHSIFDIGILMVCNWLLFFALEKLKTCGYINHWVILFFGAAYMPVLWMLWVTGIFSIYYQLSHNEYFDLVIKNIEIYQYFCLAAPFCWFLFRLKFLIEEKILEEHHEIRKNYDPVVISVFSRIGTLFICLCSVVILFHAIGIPLETLLFFRGAFLIAFGFAAQNILGNFFGFIMVLVNRPFRVGDWISSPDKKVEGIVEEIGWNSTRIRTLERRPLHVPNSIFTHIVIMNSSLMYNRHIKQVIGLRYQDVDKIDKITHDIERMLRSHADVDQDQSVMADWVEFGSYALHIEIYAFTKTTNRVLFRKIQQDIYVKIVRIIEKYGAEIAIQAQLVQLTHDKEKVS